MRMPVYADWNATTPPSAEVLEAMRRAADVGWANPSSVHGAGRAARAFVESARASVAGLTGFDARDVVLTSGGTEANNIALESLTLDAKGAPRGALITSPYEHPSVLRTATALEGSGVKLVVLPAHRSGAVSAAELERALDQLGAVALVSVQAVNHETGVLQPISELSEVCRRHRVLLHSDIVQAAGRLSKSVWAGADLVSVAAHKMRGPKGIGALVSQPQVRFRALLHGGSQERGIRPGTVDPIASAGFAEAARLALETPDAYGVVSALRDRLERKLVEDYDAKVNGEGARAPHVTNLSFEGWKGPELVAALDLEGVYVSSGAACSAGTTDPSAVVHAIWGDERSRSAVRISLGPSTSEADIARIEEAFERVLQRAR